MADFMEDEFVHELLLMLYFTKYRDNYLNGKTIKGIDRFVDMCRAKDMLDHSQTTFVVENYYDIKNGISKSERRSQVGLSDAALYRFRIKIINSLIDFLNQEDK